MARDIDDDDMMEYGEKVRSRERDGGGRGWRGIAALDSSCSLTASIAQSTWCPCQNAGGRGSDRGRITQTT